MNEEIMSSQALEFEIKKPNGSELALQAPNPFALFQQALAQGMTLEQMQVFQAMCERHEANEARKAFVVAMNRLKANPPVIEKNKHVKFGQTEYDHATLDHVCKVITKGLGEHGITHRWKVEQADGMIRVTCILTHDAGHSEETTLSGPPDGSGSKNDIQKIASTVTYLQRYTLLAATGLAAGGDNDGGGPTFGELNKCLDAIEKCKTLDQLQVEWSKAFKSAKDAGSKSAMDAINQAKDKKKASLQSQSQGVEIDWSKKQ